MHSAFEAIVERSLPTSARMDLSFDDKVDIFFSWTRGIARRGGIARSKNWRDGLGRVFNFSRNRFGLFRCGRDPAACRRDTESVEEFLCLILVNIHRI
jgi:hypothetical protein